ncbi:hypothetical protein [Nocardioides mangrovi]|uniref:Right-handed parallel beta-helix repeat-containing protein n=1 Tax=Nocardioides mangrovi TaxID=2874580 RepID=A0ABS7UFF0_9ACTN|nr:hypothetical protein [Nocardioides mangrovi]MBZ5739728.1 hypothetical protein [Nocardioides mangrovi]
MRRWVVVLLVSVGLPALALPRAAADTDEVTTELELRGAWADPLRTRIDLGADIALRDCHLGDPIRESPYPLVLDGHGHTMRQTCFEKRVLRQDGTGWLDLRDVTLTRGGSDGPGAALTSRGEILLQDCTIKENLAEEPGGGVFSMRRVTAYRCHINGNLANDDGGGIYARRGGVQVYDSVLSTNLVDGSGGAIGSTGDILVVDSWVDGNTTDGDGGALYTDEDGDVTVVRSLVDGSDADGPGGAIFTLDGDVAIYDSTLNGNRADDRGGAISGEADVLVVNSNVARNLAVAHAGGGIWARGDLVVVNSTIANNYAEGDGGGTLSAGGTTIIGSTVTRNIASVGGDVGAAGPLEVFASIIGPPRTTGVTGDTIPTERSCRVYAAVSHGHNLVADPSCDLDDPTDVIGADPMLVQVNAQPLGFVLVPQDGSAAIDLVPAGSCLGELPDPLPAGQLLEGWVDWEDVLARDTLGRLRDDDGRGCDAGAVQTPVIEPPDLDLPDPESIGAQQVLAAPRVRLRPGVRAPGGVARAGRHSVRDLLTTLDRRLRSLDHAARRFDVLLDCTTRTGVDRDGDQRHRWGFEYDERDGTGLDLRPALVPHRGHGPAQWDLLRLSTARRCLSAPADPNGAGEDARLASRRPGRWLRVLERREERLEVRTERFDAWESCLSWLPVTEAGDTEQDLGYLVDEGLWPFERRHYPAIDLDHSEWDDPDYQLLAFRGRDRPFADGECGTDPGEGVDRIAARPSEARHELRRAVLDLREDVADLGEPVEEISRFDQCLYTVGVRTTPGYRFRAADGRRARRTALSFDLRGDHLPEASVLAFPGEEPPQIECNEDAGGVETDE